MEGEAKQGHHPDYNPVLATYLSDDLNSAEEAKSAARAAAFAKQHSLKVEAETRGWDIISGEGDPGNWRSGRVNLAAPRSQRDYNILHPTPAPPVADSLPEYKRKNLQLKFASAVDFSEPEDWTPSPAGAQVGGGEGVGEGGEGGGQGGDAAGSPFVRGSLYQAHNTRDYNLLQIGGWNNAPPPSSPSVNARAHRSGVDYDILAPSRSQ